MAEETALFGRDRPRGGAAGGRSRTRRSFYGDPRTTSWGRRGGIGWRPEIPRVGRSPDMLGCGRSELDGGGGPAALQYPPPPMTPPEKRRRRDSHRSSRHWSAQDEPAASSPIPGIEIDRLSDEKATVSRPGSREAPRAKARRGASISNPPKIHDGSYRDPALDDAPVKRASPPPKTQRALPVSESRPRLARLSNGLFRTSTQLSAATSDARLRGRGGADPGVPIDTIEDMRICSTRSASNVGLQLDTDQ